jgi:ATP-dependent DNA helicase PIF1
LILNIVRLHGDITFVIAPLGTTMLLLSGGRTAHSYLKIAITLNHTSFCCIHKQDDLATLIRQTKVIIWDEVPMTNKFTFEAVDRTLCDLTDKNEPFGNIIFIMLRDFR